MSPGSGTFCPNCGKLKNHPTKEDKTITAGLEVDVPWYDSEANSSFDDPTDLYIFVNHCVRCDYTVQVISGHILPDDDTLGPRSIESNKETFQTLTEYETWLEHEFSPYTEDGLEKPIQINTDKLLSRVKRNSNNQE